jgi:hypothetical protein
MLHQGLAFKGFSVEATDGRIGSVSDFLFDERTWALRWLVVETGGWLTDRKLLLHPSVIDKVDTGGRALLVQLTRAQVEKSPGITSDEPVSRQMEDRLQSYYGVDPLWGGAYTYGGNGFGLPLAGSHAALPHSGEDKTDGRGSGEHAAGEHAAGEHVTGEDGAGAIAESAAPADPHLRSLAEVTGYNIAATDGAIGHVASFLIDDETWDIRYLVADTANWWFGRHVLLSPAAVQEINWSLHRLSLKLTCYKIKGSPPWDPTGLLDRAYEKLLHSYYDWPARYLPPVHHVVPAEAAAASAKAEAVS